MHSKGYKRVKIHFEGEDYDSTANSVTMHNVPKKKQEKATSRSISDSDPFGIPKLPEVLDTSQFGSKAKEIEVLFARRARLLNYDVAINHRLHDTCSEVPKNHCKEPSKLVNQQVTHLARQNVINLEPSNGGTAIASNVIYLSSDDEESGQGTRSALTVKDLSLDDEERGQGTGSAPIVMDLNSNDEDNGQGRHSHIFQRVEPEPVRGLLMEDSMDCLKSMVSKVDIRIDKGGNVDEGDVLVEEGGNVDAGNVLFEEGGGVDAGDVLIEEDSCRSFQEKESNYATDTEDDGLEDIQIKAPSKEVRNTAGENDITIDEGGYVGSEDDVMIEEDEHQIDQKQEHNLQTDIEDDDMASMWKEMAFTLECSKNIAIDPSTDEHTGGGEEQCDHSLVLRDDIGYVCRICGLVDKGIETIFEFQYSKVKRTTRTYASDAQNSKKIGSTGSLPLGVRSSNDDLMPSEISVHPRHRRQMKHHQVEGFNFLCGNLLTDNPGGCILAHAPGSGKTFMIITFIQSFLARYPRARPLVILPKGILGTWKKEFKTWQVEDILLLDFYTSKAENRSQQLDVFRQWVTQKSILFLGYKQFSSIVCDRGTSKVVADCQEMLLKVPSILILDEGHTPRNEDTDMVQSLAKVETHLKVVLSGTLYQNHVREVFNVLNLVRPKFLRLQNSRDVVNRIMSKVQISGVRKQLKTSMDSAFFDLVEHALQQKDENFKRKAAIIQDLREMTSQVLHYYKGDFLDELPGLVDFTVILNLSARQKIEVEKVRELAKFRRSSVGSLVYMHPQLKYFSEKYPPTGERSSFDEDRLDEMLEKLNVRDGVKVQFFLKILGLCESAGEKLLVFSQYLLPLKLLERLSMKLKGWSPEKESFMVTGDSNSEHRERSMERFNSSTDAKVFFGSIKACGEGISLVGASRILILDVHLNPSVSRQAIGRAFRPGQKRKVYAYRLVASDSPEEEDHHTCFRKELISKMWFEWNESCGHDDFEMKTVGVNDCGDPFLESLSLQEDIKLLFKR